MGVKVFVIDNGGQWTHREWRVLRELGADAEIVANTVAPAALAGARGLVLSGGAPRVGIEVARLGRTADYLALARPTLGICVGCQYLAVAFGGRAGTADLPAYGRNEITVDEPDELLVGLPERFIVWESHNDEIKTLPDVFTALAHSAGCRYEAIRHRQLPFFGLQFHPEVDNTEHGYEIFERFLAICAGAGPR